MALTAPPSPAPNRGMSQTQFDAAFAAFIGWCSTHVTEENAFLGTLSSLAAGTAFAIPYVFSAATADADPGAGYLRLGSSPQNTSTAMRLDVAGADGTDWSAVLDTFDASTSTVKGQIRLVKVGDASKWLTFNVTARATPAGYRNLTVAPVAGSAASPFADGDSLLLLFTRTGDKGDTGPAGANPGLRLLASQTVSSAVTSVDFLNVFTAAYDNYVVEIIGLKTSAVDRPLLRLAKAGTVDATALYDSTGIFNNTTTATPGNVGNAGPGLAAFPLSNSTIAASTQGAMQVEIKDVNGAADKNLFAKASYSSGSATAYDMIGGRYRGTGTASGFRLLLNGANNITAGTIRVYGVANT